MPDHDTVPAAQRETDLFPAVRDYLTRLGYEVRAEVKHCDVTARRDDDLILIELKRGFSTDLLIQATARQRLSDSVYVALPYPPCGGWSKRWRGIKHLLRRLELGLLFVQGDDVEAVFHPTPFQRQKRKAARRAVLTEMAGRSGNDNTGGCHGVKLVTAYREAALLVACCLEQHGALRPKEIQVLGASPKAQSILGSNFYGWFERVDRGVYALSAVGRAALDEYAAVADRCRAKLGDLPPTGEN
jgi:hypothetical protein